MISGDMKSLHMSCEPLGLVKRMGFAGGRPLEFIAAVNCGGRVKRMELAGGSELNSRGYFLIP